MFGPGSESMAHSASTAHAELPAPDLPIVEPGLHWCHP
jgi:hypothetical protein